jgi:hypothetical protein
MPRDDRDLQRRYEVSSFDERRLRNYAIKVATEFRHRHLLICERESESFEDRSTRMWIVAVHRGNGGKRWRTRTTAGRMGITDGIMTGHAIVLLEDGSLCAARWEWLGSPDRAKFTDIYPADGSTLMSYDRVDRGRWHDVKPNANEVEREHFESRVILGVHAKGMGVSLALKRLLDGRSSGSYIMLQ